MSEEQPGTLEQRSRELFSDSVEALDLRTRSRLTQARHAAISHLSDSTAHSGWLRWAPAYGAAAALVIAGVLWQGHVPSERFAAMADSHNGIEDLELVSSTEQLEFLQDDPEFYDWTASAGSSGAAVNGSAASATG